MRSSSTALLVMLFAATSCSSPQSDLKVRAIASQPQVEGLGEAEGQLALGNVGTALEGFRKVLRDHPGNVPAAVGIAHCYERMSRFDLSRKWFETALAFAPEDTQVLNQFAVSLDQQGKVSEAARVRSEVARIDAVKAPSATVDLSQGPLTSGDSSGALASVTVKLPPPAPADQEAPASSGDRALAAADRGSSDTPRLERLSLGEVALITTGRPIWTAVLIHKAPQSVTFRWVEVHPAARLLNAARSEGLAARTRAKLIDNGWRKIEIGDAPAVRAKTLVLYPENRLKTAQKLASQFGFTHLQAFSGSEIVVLLGRDAAELKSLRAT